MSQLEVLRRFVRHPLASLSEGPVESFMAILNGLI